ncbi:MAG: sigma-70 family RNA polymerase sigma factor [Verrucomicrobia bacterium]|nr:sigma-70 family RNA polymerase sigma factor [Verrucomicrobiota bacterium]
MNDDAELLRRYAVEGAEDAFAELVRRHLNLTWAAARRITGDADLARDVAQTVFADLARKARRLPPRTILPGWLHRAACLAAYKVNRSNRRRAEREERAMNDAQLPQTPPETAVEVDRLLPQLDAALAALSGTDRDAIALRFLSGRSLAEVGTALGVNPDTARKRVSRALERLRDWFKRRGIVATSDTLAAALVLAGSQVAPAGLAATIPVASLAAAGTIGILETLALMKAKIAWSALAVAAVATPLTYQQVTLSQLRTESRTLAAQLTEATRSSPSDAERAKQAADAAELERLRADRLELLRLRGEIGRMRADLTRAAALERELQALRAAQANTAPAPGSEASDLDPVAAEAEKTLGIAKLNASKQWALAMHLYASNHGDQFPRHSPRPVPFFPSARNLILSARTPSRSLSRDASPMSPIPQPPLSPGNANRG